MSNNSSAKDNLVFPSSLRKEMQIQCKCCMLSVATRASNGLEPYYVIHGSTSMFSSWQCIPIEMALLDLECHGRFGFSPTTSFFERVAMLVAIQLYSVLYQSSNSVSCYQVICTSTLSSLILKTIGIYLHLIQWLCLKISYSPRDMPRDGFS